MWRAARLQWSESCGLTKSQALVFGIAHVGGFGTPGAHQLFIIIWRVAFGLGSGLLVCSGMLLCLRIPPVVGNHICCAWDARGLGRTGSLVLIGSRSTIKIAFGLQRCCLVLFDRC